MKTFQEFTTEAYGRSHRGTDYMGRDYGGTPEDHERAMRTAERSKNIRGGWLEREKKKKVKEGLGEIEEGIGMTMANAIGNPPPVSKRMKLKRALIMREIGKNVERNKKKKYSGKAVSEK